MKKVGVILIFVLLVSLPMVSAALTEDVGNFFRRAVGLPERKTIEGTVITIIDAPPVYEDEADALPFTPSEPETYLVADDGARYRLYDSPVKMGRARVKGVVGVEENSALGGTAYGLSFEQKDVAVLPQAKSLENGESGQITWVVSFNDPTGEYTEYYDELTEMVQAAGADWSQYLYAPTDVSIEVMIFFRDIDTAQGGSVASVLLVNGTETGTGINIYEQGVAGEIRTGTDPNGEWIDVPIEVGQRNLVEERWWFDPDPWIRTETIPVDKIDAYSIILHELGHVIVYNGFGGSPFLRNYVSTYESNWIFENDNYYFNGESAIEVYGSAPALTYGSPGHLGNRAPRPGSDLLDTLMGNKALWDRRLYISDLDLAILTDSEVSMRGDNCAVGEMRHTAECAPYVVMGSAHATGDAACASINETCFVMRYYVIGGNEWYPSDASCSYDFTMGKPAESSHGDEACEDCVYRAVCETACLNPQPETCDMIDNDCDGQVDEGSSADVCGDDTGTFNCVLGRCVAQQCSDLCNFGERRCNGNGVQVCGNYDSDACTEWGTITGCDGTCVNGFCAPVGPECVYHDDCRNGEFCIEGDCAPYTPACYESDGGQNPITAGFTTWNGTNKQNDYCNGDILVEQYCTNSAQQSLNINCAGLQNADGTATYDTCSNGACAFYPDGTCISHASRGCSGNAIYWFDSCGAQQEIFASCGSGQTCSEYGGYAECANVACTATSGCNAGEHCVNPGTISAYCEAGCSSDADCGGTQPYCLDLTAARYCGECRTDADCPAGRRNCVETWYGDSVCAPCDADSDCGAGRACLFDQDGMNICVTACADTDSEVYGGIAADAGQKYMKGTAAYNGQSYTDNCDGYGRLREFYCQSGTSVSSTYVTPGSQEVCYEGALFSLANNACAVDAHCSLSAGPCQIGTCGGSECSFVVKDAGESCTTSTYGGTCDASGNCNCVATGAEVCDKKDNDCDGSVDEGAGCSEVGIGGAGTPAQQETRGGRIGRVGQAGQMGNVGVGVAMSPVEPYWICDAVYWC